MTEAAASTDGQYITDLLSSGTPDPVVARDLETTVKHIHDIMHHAFERNMDMYVLCDMILSDKFEAAYESFTKQSFAAAVEQLLDKGLRAYFLLWTDTKPADALISAPMKALMHRRKQVSMPQGRLGVRSSGVGDVTSNYPHQTVAVNRDLSEWIVRLELPHSMNPRVSSSGSSAGLYSQVYRMADSARDVGEPLYRHFVDLYEAIPPRSGAMVKPKGVGEKGPSGSQVSMSTLPSVAEASGE